MELRKAADPGNLCFLSDEELRARLTPQQYAVAAKGATERPFDNAYWNNHESGLYLDVVSGQPLFSSRAKYDSGSGWPSFWEPLSEDALTLLEDRSFGMVRIEVRSASSGAHLGHVFEDGPPPTGRRYCMNSAALRFVPATRLKEEGLEAYSGLFEGEGSSGATGRPSLPER